MTRQAGADGRSVIEPGWGQGRATFGGLIGALLVARMRGELHDENVPLRTVTTFLLAPVTPGPVEVVARVLRRGSSVSVLEARLEQDGVLAATAQAAFGVARASSIDVPAETRVERPRFAPPSELSAIDVDPRVAPEFFQQVSVIPAVGSLPFSGAAAPDFGGWMRFRQPLIEPAVEHVIALIDIWPPAMTPMLPGPMPVSTLSWTVDLLATDVAASFAGDGFWQYSVHTDACSDGYGHCEAVVWDSSGRAVAISRQTVSVFG